MARYVVFSFDDGRLDTYSNAFAILNKYRYPATLNVTTDFINNPQKYSNFRSAGNQAMTWKHIAHLQENGWEIASHGHAHLNDCEDIALSLNELAQNGINIDDIGFASPNSEINDDSYSKVKEGLGGRVLYIRSGLQIRREGLIYAGLTILNRKIKNRKLFCWLHKRCKVILSKDLAKRPLLAVGISSDMTEENIISLLRTLGDDECYILMFHSILSDKESQWKVDKWWWADKHFESLCKWLANQENIEVITTQQLVRLAADK